MRILCIFIIMVYQFRRYEFINTRIQTYLQLLVLQLHIELLMIYKL